ncbi:putative zinc-binding oxidoreductase protein [Phaeoacremonium minimum UCRPA7]|uniref:Putative zinc-binding oxidoreductase protein n=1 Tax=Phaeoacremonium minimum (strain UCR-PA7) TaxID=1286976 RepID=R8BGF4_PHAM7|nr:putative zinc-binding oxidoreductase protein [Phaeoacremonium minimum UCRPA7]EON98401.1 putative zinc-binding oxidoreductase protein [Phaeoacremonium minimum UCRPA7]
MKAVVFDGKGASVDPHRQVPKLRDDYILVKPVAVALNPTDWKHVRLKRAKPGCIVGCDYAGVVEAVGSAVEKKWQPGDRVFGCAHGSNLVNPDDGAFAELAAVRGDLQMRMPEWMSFEQAATLGLGTITVGQGLYQKSMQLDLPLVTPKRKEEHVLIYGGGTATAALGIQFAKQSGYSVVTVCGSESFDYAASLGAELALDYKDKDVGAKLRKLTDNKLRYAWDTIGTEQTAQVCADGLTTLSELKPLYGTINPQKCPRTDVTSTSTVMFTVFGKAFDFGPVHMPASSEDYEFGKMFYGIAENLYTKVS